MQRIIGSTMAICHSHNLTDFHIFEVSSDFPDGRGVMTLKICKKCWEVILLYESAD
jgi:hypothetical protein